jgi:phage gp29-like protein
MATSPDPQALASAAAASAATADAQALAKPEMQEIASIRRDPGLTYFGNTLRHEDETLITRGAALSYKLYDQIERDAHAGAVLDKRKFAVTSRPWEIKPASDDAVDVLAAELVRDCFKRLRFSQLCKNLLDATLKGFSVAEVIWEVRDGRIVPAKVVPRAQQRFVFNLDYQLRLRTREALVEGIELPARKFVVHTYGGKDGSPYGLGLGSKLWWPVFFKKKGITFWLAFADKFGSPTAKGTYPRGATADEQKKLLQALQAISQDAGVIVPEGMQIELLEAARSGTIDTYEKLCRYMDEQISKAVLGETMSTTAASAGLGSNQAGVHNDVRKELAEDDAGELDETLNETLIKWIVEVNLPEARLPQISHEFGEPEDLAARVDRDTKLKALGFEPTEQYILDTYGEGFVKVAARPGGAGMFTGLLNGGPQEPTFAEGSLASERSAARDAQDALAAAAEELAANWRDTMRQRVDDLKAIAEETGDYQDFRRRLDLLVDAEPPAEMVQAIARARFAAQALGRGLSGSSASEPTPTFMERFTRWLRG